MLRCCLEQMYRHSCHMEKLVKSYWQDKIVLRPLFSTKIDSDLGFHIQSNICWPWRFIMHHPWKPLLHFLNAIQILLLVNRDIWRDYRYSPGHLWASQIQRRGFHWQRLCGLFLFWTHYSVFQLRSADFKGESLSVQLLYTAIVPSFQLVYKFLLCFFEKGKIMCCNCRLIWWVKWKWWTWTPPSQLMSVTWSTCHPETTAASIRSETDSDWFLRESTIGHFLESF